KIPTLAPPSHPPPFSNDVGERCCRSISPERSSSQLPLSSFFPPLPADVDDPHPTRKKQKLQKQRRKSRPASFRPVLFPCSRAQRHQQPHSTTRHPHHYQARSPRLRRDLRASRLWPRVRIPASSPSTRWVKKRAAGSFHVEGRRKPQKGSAQASSFKRTA